MAREDAWSVLVRHTGYPTLISDWPSIDDCCCRSLLFSLALLLGNAAVMVVVVTRGRMRSLLRYDPRPRTADVIAANAGL